MIFCFWSNLISASCNLKTDRRTCLHLVTCEMKHTQCLPGNHGLLSLQTSKIMKWLLLHRQSFKHNSWNFASSHLPGIQWGDILKCCFLPPENTLSFTRKICLHLSSSSSNSFGDSNLFQVRPGQDEASLESLRSENIEHGETDKGCLVKWSMLKTGYLGISCSDSYRMNEEKIIICIESHWKAFLRI